MLVKLRCTNCGTPFNLNKEQVHLALDEVMAQGYKHFNVNCPSCGKHVKVAKPVLRRAAPTWKPQAAKAKPAAKTAAKAKPKAATARKTPTKSATTEATSAEKEPKAKAKPKTKTGATKKAATKSSASSGKKTTSKK